MARQRLPACAARAGAVALGAVLLLGASLAQAQAGLEVAALDDRQALAAPAPTPELVLRPSDWLIERDAAGTLVLHPVLPGTRLRNLSQPGWRIESDLVSGTLSAVPTRPGSDLADDRRAPVALAANVAAQLALVAPPAAGGVVVVSGRTFGRTPGHPVVHPVVHPVGASSGHPALQAPGRTLSRPAPELPGFVVPPTGLRPVIAPLLPGFPAR